MLDDEKGNGLAGGNGEAIKGTATGRQTEIATLRAVLEPLFTAYVAAGHELIPLNVPDAQDRKGRPIGKAPKFKNWRTAPALSVEEALDWRGLDGNVGVRLRPTDLVVDVDPRNFLPGDDPLARLEKDAGIALREICPTVRTGSGGLHLYLRKPADLVVRDSLEEYQGVEFKTVGRQVVAPGSVHPCGGVYEFVVDVLSIGIEHAPEATAGLLGMIRRPDVHRGDAEAGDVEPEQLAEMLEVLNATQFSDQTKWVEMMMACHHATAGEGRQEFIEWSTSDPAYVDHGWIIGRRWDSLHADNKGRRFTQKTLFMHVLDAGRASGTSYDHLLPQPERASAQEDFAGVEAEVGDLPVRAGKPKAEAPLSCIAPMSLARKMLAGKHLTRSNGDWLRYDRERNSYVEEPSEAFASRVWNWIDRKPYKKDEEIKALVAGKELIANVTAAAIAQRQGPRDLPTWHPREACDPAAADLLAVQNGLLDLATMTLLPPTPRFVTRNASPVAYDASAPLPTRWTRFLAEVFLDDQEARDTLQEVVGYLLTQDTSQQKIFCLVGPPRSGKGTINRVIQLLLGEGNYTSPTAANLARGDFGLQRLIGRQLATISDMRMGRNADPAALAENLLRISGEDEVSIDRKFKDAWEGKLPTRFLLNSNETPQFKDTSGAIISRLILMRSLVSFLGREDPGLMHELRAELPGILNWALEGLLRLRSRGYFVQPSSSKAELAAMVALASPVKAFAEERLQQSAETTTPKLTIWAAFEDWAAEAGLPYTGDMSHFFKDLKTVGLTFTESRPRIDGKRVTCVQGLALLPD